MKPILDKIGSDPEFMAGTYTEFEFKTIPAYKLISNNKQLTLNSFIGTDGHNSIGELRPRPSHNIRQHLYDIAAAIITIDEHIKIRKDLKHISIYATPELGGETLAGHIHISFFVDDPLTKQALLATRIQSLNGALINGHVCGLNTPSPPPITNPFTVAMLAEYAEEAAAERLVTPLVVARSMSFLLDPLELWLQPWFSRKRRNHTYGLGNDVVRWQQDGRNPLTRPKLVNYAWMHFEYRTPSTWLVHPWMAYVYLALVKLTMVNWPLIQTIRNDPTGGFNPMTVEPKNNEAKALFMRRWSLFKEKGRITRDASYIERAIRACGDNREEWFSNYGKIRVEAWRGLL